MLNDIVAFSLLMFSSIRIFIGHINKWYEIDNIFSNCFTLYLCGSSQSLAEEGMAEVLASDWSMPTSVRGGRGVEEFCGETLQKLKLITIFTCQLDGSNSEIKYTPS